MILLFCYDCNNGRLLQVQPNVNELPLISESNGDAASTEPEARLGMLQFALDYDFHKGEVNLKTDIKTHLFLFVHFQVRNLSTRCLNEAFFFFLQEFLDVSFYKVINDHPKLMYIPIQLLLN